MDGLELPSIQFMYQLIGDLNALAGKQTTGSAQHTIFEAVEHLEKFVEAISWIKQQQTEILPVPGEETAVMEQKLRELTGLCQSQADEIRQIQEKYVVLFEQWTTEQRLAVEMTEQRNLLRHQLKESQSAVKKAEHKGKMQIASLLGIGVTAFDPETEEPLLWGDQHGNYKSVEDAVIAIIQNKL